MKCPESWGMSASRCQSCCQKYLARPYLKSNDSNIPVGAWQIIYVSECTNPAYLGCERNYAYAPSPPCYCTTVFHRQWILLACFANTLTGFELFHFGLLSKKVNSCSGRLIVGMFNGSAGLLRPLPLRRYKALLLRRESELCSHSLKLGRHATDKASCRRICRPQSSRSNASICRSGLAERWLVPVPGLCISLSSSFVSSPCNLSINLIHDDLPSETLRRSLSYRPHNKSHISSLVSCSSLYISSIFWATVRCFRWGLCRLRGRIRGGSRLSPLHYWLEAVTGSLKVRWAGLMRVVD